MKINIEDRNFRFHYLKKIRKDKAKKLFNENIKIYFLPIKLNPLSYHNMLILLNQDKIFEETLEESKKLFVKKHGYPAFFFIDLNNKKEII